MLVLGVESSGPRGGVALLEDSRTLGEALFEAGMVHGREIAPAADRLLKAAGRGPADLDLVAVDIGPGSYTGLRVGLAAAKGLAFALGRPIVGVPSLDVLAEAAKGLGGVLATAIDAKWDQVYGALYEVRNGRPERKTEMYAERPEAFADRGARAAPRELWNPSPALVAALGRARLLEGQRDDAATVVPLYLRRTEAEEKFGPPPR
jgi:tRNA threonylcarbamoyladenosine biosynthesis protein TsaB